MADENNQKLVLQNYEKWWSKTEEAIDSHISRGESSISRLLNLAYADTVAQAPPGDRVSLFWGRPVPAPYLQANRFIRDWIADRVVDCTTNHDAIIELGSGWGYNLFNIWMRGGPRDIPYFAFEYTEAGRRCTEKVRSAVPQGPILEIHPFNHYEADLSPIVGRFDSILFYTSHTIEQVSDLPGSFIERLLEAAPKVECIHFEPVGWQFSAEVGIPLGDYGQIAYSKKHQYNRNLWALLNGFQEQGRLQLVAAEPEVMAVKVFNGTSVLHWKKAG